MSLVLLLGRGSWNGDGIKYLLDIKVLNWSCVYFSEGSSLAVSVFGWFATCCFEKRSIRGCRHCPLWFFSQKRYKLEKIEIECKISRFYWFYFFRNWIEHGRRITEITGSDRMQNLYGCQSWSCFLAMWTPRGVHALCKGIIELCSLSSAYRKFRQNLPVLK